MVVGKDNDNNNLNLLNNSGFIYVRSVPSFRSYDNIKSDTLNILNIMCDVYVCVSVSVVNKVLGSV